MIAGVRLTLGDDQMGHHLRRLVALDAGKYASGLREIGEYMVGGVQDNLDHQKLFDGSAMPQSKAALKRSGKTLIKSHLLYDSYVHQAVGSGVQVGSNKAYAAIHHFGGMAGRGKKTRVLARPVLGVAKRQELQIGYLLTDMLKAVQ